MIVDTRDEWSLRVEPEIGGGDRTGLTGVRVGEDNLFGTGTHVSGFYLNDQEEQVYGGSFFTPQFLGSRWDAALDLGRTPVGNLIYESVSYPFVGEVGRWGFRQAAQLHERYFEYVVRGEDSETFGGFVTHRVGANFQVSSSTTVRGALGTAFKEPTFNDNFAEGFENQGNPDLEP